jgi:NADH-quinone oxidoreductase subunit J
MDWISRFLMETAHNIWEWFSRHGIEVCWWVSGHWPDVASIALLAAGILWLMPRPSRLPKIVGVALALCGVIWLAIRLNATAGTVEQTALFSIFAAGAILSAILMITNRNPVYSALWFAMATLSVCGLFLLQSAPFLAAATIIVYAGAIVVTFVFVIMLAQQSGATQYDQRSRQPFLATLAAMILLGALLGTLKATGPEDWSLVQAPAPAANPLSLPVTNEPLGTVRGLGRSLFGDYLFAVELAGALLLVATIGAIAIAPRRRRGTL